MKFRTLISIAFLLLFTLPSPAVTEKEMEEARVTAAKLYLRWANNGSGYLDELSPKSMADLESKLRAKEKENIKAFKAVSIPSDYAKWDKERFVQFWGSTFFTNPGLLADGKRAKDRVKAKVSAMKVTPPSKDSKPAETEKPAETPEREEKSVEIPAAATQQDAVSQPSAEQAVAEQEKAVDEIEAAAEVEAMSAAQKKESHTWLYVTILGVLVVVVIWLMVYAANMMKKQGKEAMAAENDTDERLKKAERAAKESMADAQDQINNLKVSNSRLIEEVKSLSLALEESRASERKLKEEIAAARKEAATASAASAPRKAQPETQAKPKVITEIYLGRANNKGQFVRGDRRPNPDHTIYRLDTKDGLVGTFRVADTPDAVELALSNPLQFLAGGCNSDNFEDAETATSIVTEAAGTAILEGGCWKVIRKSRIRFE